ncbi:hypothetical protein JCM10212_004300 [Sporobolomyces blumeae]
MHVPSAVALVLASGLWTILSSDLLAHAHSTHPPPLHPRAVVHPLELTYHVLPRSNHVRRTDEMRDPLERRRRGLDHPPALAQLRADPAFGDDDGDADRPPVLDSSSAAPRWDDKFLVSFIGHDDEPVTISLRPSTSLVPPQGIKSLEREFDPVLRSWSTVEKVIPRHQVKAYEGWVLKDGIDVERFVREETAGVVRPNDRWTEFAQGWARVTLDDDADDESGATQRAGGLRFQGAYMKDGETFTVHSTERYLRTKDVLDPSGPLARPYVRRDLAASTGMVIVRERDTLSPEERVRALRKRGLPIPNPDDLYSASTTPSCPHDQLAFNTDPAHPVLSNAVSQSLYAEFHSPWVPFLGLPSPLSPDTFEPADRTVHSSSPLIGRHAKRQAGDISGGSGTSSNFINSIGSTQGCPKSAMVVFVGVAADCTYVDTYGSTDAARRQILGDFNSVSALYQQTFNISIGIVELAVMSGTCPTTSSEVDQENPWNLPCQTNGGTSATGGTGNVQSSSSLGIDLNSRLSVFSQWRGDKGGADGAGLWHLLSACSTGSEVGVAWLGQLCRVAATSSGGQTTSGTGVTAITRNEWQVIAHEIGHNFGAIHDCASGCSLSGSCCPLSSSTCNAQANYIMSPVSSKNVSAFSPCSVGNVCSTIGNSLNTTCIKSQFASGNPRIISEQSCGNGIVEDGEECDPGSATSSCCDPSTCKFRAGAVCDPINSLCCTSSCQVAGSGTVCRPSLDSRCDKEEVCDGSSSDCPDDEYEKNGKSCGDGLSCTTGVCTSRDLQCQNAGSSLNLQSACPQSASQGCSIVCNDPSSRSSCVILDQSFRDGTSCGYGGRCENGECQTGSALDTAKGWYRENLRIAIPVTIVVGIIVLLILFALIRCCFCGNRRKGGFASSKPPKGQPYSSNYANGYGGQNGFFPHQNAGGMTQTGGFYAPPPGPPPRAYGGGNVLRR